MADGSRPTNEKRLHRSPCSTDSSRKPGAVTDELQERGDGSLEVAEQLGPHRHDAVFGGERVELVARRLQVHEPNLRKKQVRAPV